MTDPQIAVESDRPAPHAWLTVGLLWFVALLNYLDRLTITTMRDPITADITMTDAQFGLLTAVFLWVYGVLSPAGGFLADRFGRRRIIVASLVVWSAMTALTGTCQTVGQLLAVRALMGVSEACYIPAALAMIADYHRGSTRSLATGIHMSGVYAGAALGGLGGYIAAAWSWRAGFGVFGSIGIVYAFILLASLREGPRRAPDVTPNVGTSAIGAARDLLTRGSFLLLLLHISLLALAFWGINGWLPTYLRERFRLGLGEAGLSATGYVQAASFVGILVGGTWADRWSRSNVRGRILVPVIGFIVAGPALFLSMGTDALGWALAGLVVFGLARGFSDANMMPILCQVVDPRYRATGYGVMNCFGTLVGGAMIYAGGALRDVHVGLAAVFQVAAVGLVIAALLLSAVRPRQDVER